MSDVADAVAYYLGLLRHGQVDEAFHGLIELGPVALAELARAFRDERNAAHRAAVVQIAGQYRVDDALQVLGPALRDPDANVWKEAIDGLVTLRTRRAVSELLSFRAGLERVPENAILEWIDEAIQQITSAERRT